MNNHPYPDQNQPTIAVSDIGEIAQLRDALTTERLTSANRLAAIRAALGAAADGEADPLAYLRDELPDEPGGAHGA